jgi:hypothetical protein
VSGVGIGSGWVCDGQVVELEFDGVSRFRAAYPNPRGDTQEVCGDADNGFGVLINWNLLGDGEHTVVAFVDGVEFDRATFTVTTLGTQFLRGASGGCVVPNFAGRGDVTLQWQQGQQNFVIVDLD